MLHNLPCSLRFVRYLLSIETTKKELARAPDLMETLFFMNPTSPIERPGHWLAQQRAVFVWVALGFAVLLAGMVALAAWDRSRRGELEQVEFVLRPPDYFTPPPALARGTAVGALLQTPLYTWQPNRVPSSDRELMPVGRLEGTGILVYQSRTEEKRLRKDGTGQYFVPTAPGQFLELTDFPPAP